MAYKKQNFNFIKYLWVLPFVVGILISYFSPLNILSYEVPKFIVDVMSNIIPMISKLNGNYERVQVVMFYFSVMWMLSPIVFFSIYVDKDLNEKMTIIYRKRSVLRLIGILLMLIVLFYFLIFKGLSNKDALDIKEHLIFNSKAGLSAYGFIYSISFSFFCGLLFIYLKNFKKIFGE